MRTPRHIIVIGAGLGGLAAAIRLARLGFRVSLFEKNHGPGGKMNIWSTEGFQFDTGPSLLTMPFVLGDLFAAAGRRMEDHLQLVPVDPLCRYRFADGSILDATTDVERMTDAVRSIHPPDALRYPEFLAHAEKIYRHAAGPFLFDPLLPLSARTLVRALPQVPSLVHIDAFRTLHDAVRSFFHHAYVQQSFDRFATYNGSSPYRAPATLALIPYIEFVLGGLYVRGGMYALVRALEETACAVGVHVAYGSEIRRIVLAGRRATGVETIDGQMISADAVVCNADVLYAEEHLFDTPNLRLRRRVRRAGVSLSGFVMLLGIRGVYPGLLHHNVFFSSDYAAEFQTLVERGLPSDEPTVYVAVTSRTDPAHAPEGHSTLFVLVNAPPVDGRCDWEKVGLPYRTAILQRLEQCGLHDLSRRIVVERTIAPPEFAAQYNAYQGSIYGMSSNTRFAAFLRPSNISSRCGNVFYVGGSTHPGGGIPLVLLSGAITANRVRNSLG